MHVSYTSSQTEGLKNLAIVWCLLAHIRIILTLSKTTLWSNKNVTLYYCSNCPLSTNCSNSSQTYSTGNLQQQHYITYGYPPNVVPVLHYLLSLLLLIHSKCTKIFILDPTHNSNWNSTNNSRRLKCRRTSFMLPAAESGIFNNVIITSAILSNT